MRSGNNRLLGPRVKLGIFGLEIEGRKWSRIMNDGIQVTFDMYFTTVGVRFFAIIY
jgi:hypothetical protein